MSFTISSYPVGPRCWSLPVHGSDDRGSKAKTFCTDYNLQFVEALTDVPTGGAQNWIRVWKSII